MTTPCPCGSQKELADCCLPYVEGRAFAPTAEALMRSRFTAYSLGRVDYILTTYDPRIVMQQDAAGIADWARRSQFWKLEILKTEAGGPDDLKGTVHFNATIWQVVLQRRQAFPLQSARPQRCLPLWQRQKVQEVPWRLRS
jgi:SEC-C motif domain protein